MIPYVPETQLFNAFLEGELRSASGKKIQGVKRMDFKL
jgi:hypothetical protein